MRVNDLSSLFAWFIANTSIVKNPRGLSGPVIASLAELTKTLIFGLEKCFQCDPIADDTFPLVQPEVYSLWVESE